MIKSLPVFILALICMGATCKQPKDIPQEMVEVEDRSPSVPNFEHLKAPEWSKNSVIYEANIRQGSASGKFMDFLPHLGKMKMLGADILWLMPIHPIGEKNRKGSLGSYYSVKDYTAINPEFGDTAQFRLLVTQAHQLGIKVILDWVANHTAWDHPWISQHPEWYAQDSAGNIKTPYDWSDVAKLNFENKDMREAMIQSMEYWVKNFDIDGFRCDVAFLVPEDFWVDARKRLHRIKPMFMLAEMEWNTDITNNPAGYFHEAFDAHYGWDFMGTTQDIAAGKKPLSALDEFIARNYARFPRKSYKMFFLSNHDENTWNGTTQEKYGDDWRLYSILAYTLQQSFPLIYMGEEANNTKRLRFFDKDTILSWRDTSRYDWYRTLNGLKHQNKALWNGEYGGDMLRLQPVGGKADSSVFAYLRRKDGHEVVVILNFSDKEQTFQLLSDWAPTSDYSSLWGNGLEFNGNVYSIKPKGYHIYFKQP